MWRYFEYEELTSTNDEALALTASAGGEKLAVTATRQTGGRGRRGRSWVSLEGNLFMSLALPFAAEKKRGAGADLVAVAAGGGKRV